MLFVSNGPGNDPHNPALGRILSEHDIKVARIADATEQIQVHLDRASASGELLGQASERLAASRARLDVQLQAVREARHTIRRVLWFLPGV